MIDLKDFRENPDKYRRAAKVKQVNVEVDHVLGLDAERLRGQQALERLRAEQNEASARIGALTDVTAKQAAIAQMARSRFHRRCVHMLAARTGSCRKTMVNAMTPANTSSLLNARN